MIHKGSASAPVINKESKKVEKKVGTVKTKLRWINHKGHTLMGGTWYEAPAWTAGKTLYVPEHKLGNEHIRAYTMSGIAVDLYRVEE